MDNITLINIVRSEKQVEIVRSLGGKYVLNSQSKTFPTDLEKMFKELRPMAFFDAVCGPVGSLIAIQMPPRSTVYTYGNLSREDYTFNPSILIFKSIKFEGVWLTKYAGAKETQHLAMNAFEKIKEGKIKTIFAKEYPPQQIKEALQFYSTNASDGKVLIVNPKYAQQRL